LDELGLAAAIDWQSEEFQKHTDINCELTIEPKDITLNEDLSTTIFRILQEGLTNVARHAGASKVDVNLKQGQNNIELVISDNGKGITEMEIHNPTSFGLMGIRERAQFLGGNVKFQGIRNKGTTISLNIPLRKS
jgi:signal transduction histidine kinase